jgi:threonine/homoserine/homoserine lactone efflux protein
MGNEMQLFDRMPEISRIGSFPFLMWAILIGVFLSVVVNMGPAFITLLQTSLHRGFRSAAWFAFGVILNDTMVVLLCILTSVQVTMKDTKIDPALFCIGAGVILVLFGVFTFRKKVRALDTVNQDSKSVVIKNSKKAKSMDSLDDEEKTVVVKNDVKPAWYVFLGKGFALNILNPFVWIFWFSSVAIVAGNMGGNKTSTLVFFAIILGTTLTLELLKAWGAARLKRFLNPKRTMLMNRIAGVLLMLCGAYFIIIEGVLKLI